jgi:hypothetical protein
MGLKPSAPFHGAGSTGPPVRPTGIESAGMLTRKPVRVVESGTRKTLDGHGSKHASGSSPSGCAHGGGALAVASRDPPQLPSATAMTSTSAAPTHVRNFTPPPSSPPRRPPNVAVYTRDRRAPPVAQPP